MSVVLFRRPARRPGPDMPEGELSLQEPPTLSEVVPDSSAVWQYLPMALMSVSMMLMFMRPSGQQGGRGFMYLALGLMLVASVAMIAGQFMKRGADRKNTLKAERRDYLRYLTQTRRKVRASVVEQQRALIWRHLEPAALWSLVGTSRLWERRPTDKDFAEVRVAVGDQKLGLRLNPLSTKPVEDLEPLCAHALRSFIRAYSIVPDQPIAIYLKAWARVLLRGDEERLRAMVRALLCQLATLHAPDDLWIAICAAEEHQASYEWAKWLPHSLHPHAQDGAGPVRRVVHSFNELEDLLGPEIAERPAFDPEAVSGRDEPYCVIVLDGVPAPGGHRFDGLGSRNTVVLDIGSCLTWRPGKATLRLDLTDDEVSLVRTDRDRKEQTTALGRPDAIGVIGATSLAKRLAPHRIGFGADSKEPLSSEVELTALLGIPDLHRHDAPELWRRRSIGERLRVPVAVAADGIPVELDIKESAQGGTGPHGMLIGATGSGKSELLRTLVLALALTNSSETLNFVLVDFKGGATFLGLDALPHTSAVITNLADEVALVARMQDALHGELMRRQELLRRAGNYTSALDYEKARAAGAQLDPLPSLFVVVDEFSELLSAHREFMDLFVMIGRLGRSLGVHLLLASQRLDEGRMHQLESHLSYRIGLRTFSAMESRGVLGVPDAYELPPQPGAGFMKTGVEALIRFRAAYVSGPYARRGGAANQERVASQVVPWTAGWVVPRTVPDSKTPATPAPEADEEAETLLSVAVERMRDAGPPAHQVWLPPLAEPPALDALLPGLAPHPDFGLTPTGWAQRGTLNGVPVGIVDRPFEQKRDLLCVDLAGSGGHIAIAGGPQSGKSTLVRTLMTSLALTHSPREVQFYCLDFGGGTLAGLTGLPHVGGVAARLDEERVGRVVAEVTTLLSHRERLFLEEGIDSMATFRRRRAAGALPGETHGDVFLIIDGWSTVRQDFDQYVAAFNALAARGLNYGIHLVVTTARWVELSSAVRDQSGTHLELRMGDAMDSGIDLRKAADVPRTAGRGLTREGKLHYLAALPRIDGSTTAEDLSDGVAALVAAVQEAWTGPVAPPVRMLPTLLPASELPPPDGDVRIPLGLEENALSTVYHDFSQTPHMIVVGDTESGKTNTLKLVAEAVMKRYTPAEARIMIVDYRRELVEAVPDEYRLGHAVSIDALKDLLDGAARAVVSRVPGPDISPSRMRTCDWWQGPRLFVLVDDYDMVSGNNPMNQPFGPLLDHLALGYEVGLHLVVARAAAGAGRGLNETLMRRLQEVNTPSLLLSCPPAEGYVFGNVKGRILPPGRATRIARRRNVQVQLALTGPETS
ncbi:type VII secretion protein EccCa [Streptomyces sp. NPDC056485]|uniref:type VII secretion protein EccCa n=1 Tax=Streptomyces sp. NPDC056485 TaxID=3345834 RepID=UPI0036C1E3B2